jgi:aromatic ring-opening dioxygenase catalytic subunit (LigB family)
MMPVVFVSHGAPTLALDQKAGADFARLAAALPRPRAILVIEGFEFGSLSRRAVRFG